MRETAKYNIDYSLLDRTVLSTGVYSVYRVDTKLDNKIVSTLYLAGEGIIIYPQSGASCGKNILVTPVLVPAMYFYYYIRKQKESKNKVTKC